MRKVLPDDSNFEKCDVSHIFPTSFVQNLTFFELKALFQG